MSVIIVVIARPETAVEDQLNPVSIIMGVGVGGSYSCRHYGVGDTKGGRCLLLDRWVLDTVGFS